MEGDKNPLANFGFAQSCWMEESRLLHSLQWTICLQ